MNFEQKIRLVEFTYSLSRIFIALSTVQPPNPSVRMYWLGGMMELIADSAAIMLPVNDTSVT